MESIETHDKIINVIKEKGPSLPIQISKEIGMSSLFISAFLSELASSKRIKVSHLKIGGSPLYFLDGQEEQLEKFYKYLHPKEAETFLLIKKQKILKDEDQEPSVRVALRSIRDFAVGFKKNDEIYWRYILASEQEANDLIKPKKIQKPEKLKQKIPEKSKESEQKTANGFESIITEIPKKSKQKPKSAFVEQVIGFISENNLKILEEKDYKAKEYNCILEIKSELGNINFLTLAKDKKTITETDLKKLLTKSQKLPLPAFFLFTGNLSKKAIDFAEKYSSILKVKKI